MPEDREQPVRAAEFYELASVLFLRRGVSCDRSAIGGPEGSY
jgi:hypothetical protein